MGNSCFGAAEKSNNKNVVQLVKMDGKIMEFSASILVKDVLQTFSGYNVALSRDALQHLPLNSRLKLGDMYYLIPSVENYETAEGSPKVEKEEGGSVKRIKVVITRQQLQDLLSKQVLAVDFLSGLKCTDDEKCRTIWKPELESIPEEHEIRSIF
ncbi:Glutaminase-asparaginase [Heracleum sosnowskyi]|uniref:Glutaminase-asparaginase n=1 Tax=Heracleum sosnowskyi TaxID=360622 RepID=A0AAD8HF86_9APIA|nr:Glutaminase-asparaginase [Heracleum sosnowskyi]